MKKATIAAAALALTLAAGAGIGKAHAYFTTYAEARGGYILALDERTDIDEDFYDWTKHVSISSTEESRDVYVRAKAFGPSDYPLEYSGSGWTLGDDGWWYYDGILHGGEATPELQVRITGVSEDDMPEEGENFNVVVVYETTPVEYDENGNPHADWSYTNGGGESRPEGGGD